MTGGVVKMHHALTLPISPGGDFASAQRLGTRPAAGSHESLWEGLDLKNSLNINYMCSRHHSACFVANSREG